ncbi:MAG: hypothetical protein ABII88_03630 [Candidatus Omnitrophota bacterium]
MKSKFTKVAILIISQIFFLTSICLSKQTGSITAKSVLVMDADKGIILYELNPYQKLPAASTVKVLTGLLAAQELKGSELVSISKRAEGIAPTKLYLTHGTQYKAEDMIKCILINSANDAGVALAEAISGTEIKFSVFMNTKAKELGAKKSFFLNATGLPEGKKRQYSTAYDLCVFMRHALKYPDLVNYMKIKNTVITGTDGRQIELRNHNKMLWRQANTLIGKTGYTRRAGHCFLGMFTRGKKKYLVAVLGSRKIWNDLEYLTKRRY